MHYLTTSLKRTHNAEKLLKIDKRFQYNFYFSNKIDFSCVLQNLHKLITGYISEFNKELFLIESFQIQNNPFSKCFTDILSQNKHW